jgi:catechol 2,3-dioxygenase-like lactoylglutathione lyase family enzyme
MPIPTFRSADHFGIVVPDLEQAVEFFENVLGASVLRRGGRPNQPDFMIENFHAPADSSYRLAMLRLPPDLNLELFEWTSSETRTTMPCLADLDAHHLALRVDDIDAATTYLTLFEGVAMLGRIKTVPSGVAGAGTRYVYLTAPWGLHLELVDRTAALGTP